jgi:hypothetical protein
MRNGNLWHSLSENQKQEVLIAFEESEDENKLMNAEMVFGKASSKENEKKTLVISTKEKSPPAR